MLKRLVIALGVCLVVSAALRAGVASAQDCGFLVSAEAGLQQLPQAIADGSGGAYVAWIDGSGSSSLVYVTRVAQDGTTSAGWPTGGIAVSEAGVTPSPPGLALDGTGGVFIGWLEGAAAYVHRATGSGAVAPGWPAGGAEVRDYGTSDYALSAFCLSADGEGGVFATWSVRHTYCYTVCETPTSCYTICDNDSYAEVTRVTGSGDVQWSRHGSLGPWTNASQSAPDGVGGLYLLEWMPFNSITVTATRIGPTGATMAGWPVNLNVGGHFLPRLGIVRSTPTGMFAAWQSFTGVEYGVGVYVNSVRDDGTSPPGWASPRLIGMTPGNDVPALVPTSGGGVMVGWIDPNARAMALALDASGEVAAGWPAGGVGLSDVAEPQNGPLFAGDGMGGVFATSLSTGSVATIRVHRVAANGSLSPTFGPTGTSLCSGTIGATPPIVRTGELRALAVWASGSDSSGCCDIRGAFIDEDIAVPTRVARMIFDVSGERVLLSWWLTGERGEVEIERATHTAGPWDPLGARSVDASGHLQLEDDMPAEGRRYYRLRTPGSPEAMGESTLEVERAAISFGIVGPTRNPVHGEIELIVQVPAGRASLELFDVSGRRVARREVSSSGRVSLGGTGTIRAGVYVVRLTQNDLSATSRICVVP